MPDWVSKRNLDITAEHPFAGGSYTNGEYEVCGVIPDLPAAVLGQTYTAATRNPVKTLGQD